MVGLRLTSDETSLLWQIATRTELPAAEPFGVTCVATCGRRLNWPNWIRSRYTWRLWPGRARGWVGHFYRLFPRGNRQTYKWCVTRGSKYMKKDKRQEMFSPSLGSGAAELVVVPAITHR